MQFQQKDDPDNYLNMGYEVHLRTKVDYLFFQRLQTSFTPPKYSCYRRNMSNNVTDPLYFNASLQKPSVSRLYPQRNRFLFLETDGSLPWLYRGSIGHSLLHTMNQFFDRIHILYEVELQSLDHLTRQTYPHSVTQTCSDRIKNLFQLELNQEH